MYSPTMRVLAVLALLQAHDRMSGGEIARRLEIDTRTVRRYITMLQDMGVPVEGERGPHGAYRLGRGSQMPPLIFTDGEAIALSLGLIAMKRLNFPVNPEDVEGALAKTERVLPTALLQLVRSLQEAIVFQPLPAAPTPAGKTLAILSVAVRTRQPVQMTYRAFDGALTERGFEPYGVVYYEGTWYAPGYCRLRNDLRTFRLDRIEALDLLQERFSPPNQFDAVAWVSASLGTTRLAEHVRVLIRAPIDMVVEVLPLSFGTVEESTDGVIYTPSALVAEWLPSLLVNLPFDFVILEPDSLRERVREMGERAIRLAGRTSASNRGN